MIQQTRTTPRNFSREPLFWLAAFFALGIAAGQMVSIPAVAAIIAAVVFAVGTFVLERPSAAVLVFISFGFAGMAAISIERQGIDADRIRSIYDSGAIESGSIVEVEGILATRPEVAFEGNNLRLRVEKLRHRGHERSVSGNVRVYVRDPVFLTDESLANVTADLKYGSRIRTVCRLERENDFANPGVITTTEILDRSGVDAGCLVKSRLLIEHLADESVFLPLAWIYDQRASLITDLERNLSQPAAGVMIASLLGNKKFLDKQTAEVFRDGGTFHILVISGLHITFIGGLILWFVKLLTRRREVQFIVTTTLVWAYTLAVGADVPVVRAAIMFTAMSFAYILHRQTSLLNALGLSVLIILTWRPSDLFDASFQLTFVSVAAIVAIAYPLLSTLRKIGTWMPTVDEPFPPRVPNWLKNICEMIYWKPGSWTVAAKRNVWTARLLKPQTSTQVRDICRRIVAFIVDGMVVSFIVQLAMVPLTVAYFHRISMASVLLNLWVSVTITIESFAAVFGVFAMKLTPLLGTPLIRIAEIANSVMLSLPKLFSDNGWASFRLPAYNGNGRLVYVPFFLAMIILAIAAANWRPFRLKGSSGLLKRSTATASVVAVLCSAIIAFHPFITARPDGRLHIDLLDVGQGDATFVTFPDGRTMLIDGGGRPKYGDGDEGGFVPDFRTIGDSVVSEVLWAKGISRIDLIVATHADADHMQGLGDAARNFDVGKVLLARVPDGDRDFDEFVATIQRRQIPIEIVGQGDRLEIGGVAVDILHPSAEPRNGESNNENSIVMMLTFGDRRFLFTGDIEGNAELRLTSGEASLEADVIKVPHHGSRTSSSRAFVEAVSPQLAIVSVGRRSQFGHPHSDVVERWQQSGAIVLTTGENGMISISTDGKELLTSSRIGK